MKSKLDYIKRNIKFLWTEYHFLIPPKKLKNYLKLFFENFIMNRKNKDVYNIFNVNDYNKWLIENENDQNIIDLKYKPLISIVIPVFNVPIKYLQECIDSVLNQTYQNFEICIADDCSTDKEVIKALKEYEKKSEKIKVFYRTKNGHISAATNSALAISKGEFIALLDNDDILSVNALYEMVKVLNEDKNIDFIYSDEDKINLNGQRCDPHFKPDWSPDTFFSHNYICHFSMIRKSIIDEIEGFREGYEGSQDYDLFLRVIEKTKKIYHIPKILYHWRMIEGSTSMTVSNKSYASVNGIKSLNDALDRKNIKATISNIYTSYIIKYEVIDLPKVSIIIPTKDKIKMLIKCVESIYEKTSYQNYEIIIIDNNSKEEKTQEGLDLLKNKYKNIKIIEDKSEFNYSKLNNEAIKHSSGEYILLMNNDVCVINPEWLEVMLGYAQQNHIGAVGPKLLFSDNKIQHAGVVLGVGEEKIANHAYYMEEKNAPNLAGRLLVPYNYSALTGACLLFSKSKYEEVNGLNENLIINYNDIDFCLKLIEKGYYNVMLPQIEMYHYESQSRGKELKTEFQIKEFNDSSKYMKTKWREQLKNDPFYNINFSRKKCFTLDKKIVKQDIDIN